MEVKYKNIFATCFVITICALSISFVIIGMKPFLNDRSEDYFRQSESAKSNVDLVFFATLGTIIYPTETNVNLLAEKLVKNQSFKIAKIWLHRAKKDDQLSLLGEVYLAEDRYDRAVEIFRKIKDDEVRNHNLARAYYFSGNLAVGDEYLSTMRPNEGICDLAAMANSATLSLCTAYLQNIPQFAETIRSNDSLRLAKLSYNLANERNYPQLSLAILKRRLNTDLVDRDVYIEASKRYFELNDYVVAKTFLFKAIEKDAYFPQVYKQLLMIAEVTGDTLLQEQAEEKLLLLEDN